MRSRTPPDRDAERERLDALRAAVEKRLADVQERRVLDATVWELLLDLLDRFDRRLRALEDARQQE